MYANWDYCSCQKIIDDFKAFCPDEYSCLTDEAILANIKSSILPLGTKLYELFNTLMSSEMLTDDEVFTAVDKVGEMYGSIISYVLGFDMRFNGNDHAHKKLAVPQVSMPRLPKLFKLFN
jgi:hypothetical protein